MILLTDDGCLGSEPFFFFLQDSDWEETHGDMDSDKDLLSSAAATPFGRSGYEHLEAMAKAYNEV